MRVLHVYRTYFPDSQGGLEEVIRQTCLSVAPYDTENRVFSLSRSPSTAPIKIEDATVYRSKLSFELASCGVSLPGIVKFGELSSWADIVHYHFPWPFADFLHFATGVTKPTVLTYHSDVVRQRVLGRLYSPLRNRFLHSVDRIVCTSPNYFASSDVLSRYSDKVDTIPIGIDGRSFPAPSDDELRAIENEHGRDFFLFVGVLRYYKGLHILLDAIVNAPFHVVIVGSGPTELELRAQASRLGLTNVTFTGYLPDSAKFALFKLCRGVVFPSYLRSEAFGVTLLEGAMFGKPLISTEVGSGTSHVNIDGETGFVVAPGVAKPLREAMDQLHYRPEMAELMGRRARARYEKLFTGELMGRRYHELYQRLLDNNEEMTQEVAAG